MTFLKPGKMYETIIYRDADNADWQTNPEAYSIEKKMVTNKTRLKILLAKSGGCAIIITEVKSG